MYLISMRIDDKKCAEISTKQSKKYSNTVYVVTNFRA